MNPTKFFNDQILVITKPFRTIGDDITVENLTERVVSLVGEKYRGIITFLASSVVYTKRLEFSWNDDVPAEYRNFEVLSQMIADEKPFEEIYQYAVDNLPIEVLPEWRKAVDTSLTIWKPASQYAPAGTTDPK